MISRWLEEGGIDRHSYRLEDGTELLEIEFPLSPANYSTGMLDALPEDAQENIRAYYIALGTLYDVNELLAAAYDDYLACQANPDLTFENHFANQDTSPCGETEAFVAFRTTVNVLLGIHFECRTKQIQTCQIFDRETGELMDPWSLFLVPKEDAVHYIFYELCKGDAFGDSLPSREALVKNLKAEHITWYLDGIEIMYPAGTLDGERDPGIGFGFTYEEFETILHPWAIPEYTLENSNETEKTCAPTKPMSLS